MSKKRHRERKREREKDRERERNRDGERAQRIKRGQTQNSVVENLINFVSKNRFESGIEKARRVGGQSATKSTREQN